ncbi:MAG: hypothetical protein ACI94Y_001394 [Maribacter sp.]|jgi:hypothetical protein
MKTSLHSIISLLLFVVFFIQSPLILQAQDHSVAREWNEVLLGGIRNDFARPTVHARNLYHTSIGMYDAWAAFDPSIETFLLGKTLYGYDCPYSPIPIPEDIKAAREEAISYVAYRLLRQRFLYAPQAADTYALLDQLMDDLGYDKTFTGTDYINDGPAALGNYIAQSLINYGGLDQSNEDIFFTNQFYSTINNPLITDLPGNPNMNDPNRWQPLTLEVFIDQSGNTIPFNTPEFLGPEWGAVDPFALGEEDKTTHIRDGYEYIVYHDPGNPPLLDTLGNDPSTNYKWGFSLVSTWSSHLDPADGVIWDISPASIGNIQSYPTSFDEYDTFYDLENGGDPSIGHAVNPVTGQPYEPQLVPRADYARVLAEFWADGPDSETPPGHWFSILNYVNDHPLFEKKYKGQGDIVDDLEWDVKAYFIMGGAMHDSAVTAWGIKGWYDYLRPISAVRYMGGLGQSSDSSLPSYHVGGIPLIPNYIELVEVGDPLAGTNDENVGKIKVYAWKGPNFIQNPATDVAGVDWILSDNWWPYQRPSFVTPPFAGYISGHSTFSSAAAEVMETITGDAFFPGGMGEFNAPQNEFLVFEDGPSVDIVLQWATYKDASDQTSLSRIWGGIHPPADDIPGRLIGEDIGEDAINYAESFFLVDSDNDGFFSNVDCDDTDNSIFPFATEICDGLDNDCNGIIDDGLTPFTYYIDTDNDGFGDAAISLDTCLVNPPLGYIDNDLDCNDNDNSINPSVTEICDGIDNNCDGVINEGLDYYTYYLDVDGDNYGDLNFSLDTCIINPPIGYADNSTDCNDNNANINPGIDDIPDNEIDEDCSGIDYYQATKIYPNPVRDILTIHYDFEGEVSLQIFDKDGRLVSNYIANLSYNSMEINLSQLSKGVYILKFKKSNGEKIFTEKVIVY